MQRVKRNRAGPRGGRGHGGATYQVPDAEDDGAGADMAAEAAAVGIETRPGRVQHLRGSRGSALLTSRRAAPRGGAGPGRDRPSRRAGPAAAAAGGGWGGPGEVIAAPGGSLEEPASFPPWNAAECSAGSSARLAGP